MRSVIGKKLLTRKALDAIHAVFQGVPFVDQEWKAGDRVLLVSGYPMVGYNNKISGCLATAVDISQLRKIEAELRTKMKELRAANSKIEEANRKLSEMAVTDGLTKIANRRALMDRLAICLEQAERGQRFTLAMIDVDHFKKFNDEFGHQAGDEILIAVAQTLKSSVRKLDFVARYGGEEFCVLFVNASLRSAVKMAERIRKRISEIQNPYRAITASFGLAEHPGLPIEGDQLVRAADDALYDAKAAGRNRVAVRSIEFEEAA